METRCGWLEVLYSARGIPTYRLELWHDGLKKHRLIKGPEKEVVRRKGQIQSKEWEEKWAFVEAREKGFSDKNNQRKEQQFNKDLATRRTDEALSELSRVSNILKETLEVDDAINWDNLEDKSEFAEPVPLKPSRPAKPQAQPLPHEPRRSDKAYQPCFSFFDKLISSRKDKLIDECNTRFESDQRVWQQEVEIIEQKTIAAENSFKDAIESLEKKHESDLREWRERKAEFIRQQEVANEAIEKQRALYLTAAPEEVIGYCDMVLAASKYPDYFPKEFDIDYIAETKILIVDYLMPAPEAISTLKGIKYVISKDTFEEQHISQAQLFALYDSLLYQIVLRTIHEIFEADAIEAISIVVFNGIVTSIDRSTGKQITACVLSIQAQRGEFGAINLANVEPKTCFKALKGVGSSKLHGLAPVPPLMRLRRDDGRFVAGYEVANGLDSSSNLAAMDWEDFEHLIREVFAKEFSTNGGEVKVTRASRDGGVDAVAFDPDPIRGGKIVIQAKRYTNTVGVGAVRDLYGTVMNEGANKGILVTTSDYGPDSYAFANGKPLVLLSGANLLHILNKHGHKARIDLQEARKLSMGQ
jgi:restriction system protein